MEEEFKGDIKDWVRLSIPFIIAFSILIPILLSKGDVIFNNLGIFILEVGYWYALIVVVIEIINRLMSKSLGGK